MECSICRTNIKNSLYITICKHYFHINCIEEWYRSKETCPVCSKLQYRKKFRYDDSFSSYYNEYYNEYYGLGLTEEDIRHIRDVDEYVLKWMNNATEYSSCSDGSD